MAGDGVVVHRNHELVVCIHLEVEVDGRREQLVWVAKEQVLEVQI